MNRLDGITEAYLLATGKAKLPAEGSSKRLKLEALAVKIYRDWQTEPDTEWESLSQDVSVGPVTTAASYTIGTPIHRISKELDKYVYIIPGTGSGKIPFKIVPKPQLSRYDGNVVAYAGGQKIQFARAFTSTEQAFGGTIFVPAVTKLPDITDDESEILIDDPNWFPIRLAAQYVLNDTQLNYLYDDLLAQANELMSGMKDANEDAEATTSTGANYFGNGL